MPKRLRTLTARCEGTGGENNEVFGPTGVLKLALLDSESRIGNFPLQFLGDAIICDCKLEYFSLCLFVIFCFLFSNSNISFIFCSTDVDFCNDFV